MKKYIIIILILILGFSQSAHASALPWGYMQGSFGVGIQDTGTADSLTLNENFVNTSSGDFVGVKFMSPVNQSSANLTFYVYCTGQTGTTNETAAILLAGPSSPMDDDRPTTGAASSTSATVDASGCGSSMWLQYDFTNVTLEASKVYYLGVINTEADPVTNSFSVQYRGTLDGPALGGGNYTGFWGSGNTANGFTTDAANANIPFSGVVKFNDGSMLGNPFVSALAHANNTNYRGYRVNMSEDWKASCATFVGISSVTLSYNIYQGSTLIYTATPDLDTRLNIGGTCFPTINFTGGLDYDFLFRPSAGSTLGNSNTMGNSPPADIQMMNPNFTYVDGATPGSLTETTTSVIVGSIVLDDNPAIVTPPGGGSNSGTFIIQGRGIIQ